MTKSLFVGAVVLALTGIVSAQSKSPIQGVWKITEDATLNTKPQPGFYIFTASHYSITRVSGDKPRMAPKEANKPTIEELTDANRFVAQFGPYEVKGDSITLHPSVTRNPATMNVATASGAAPITGTFKLEGTTLTLTTKNPANGHAAVLKLTWVE